MANRKKSGRGFKPAIFSGITLIVIASGILGWAKVNDISNISDVYRYFKSVSDKAWNCGAGSAEWNCDTSLGGGTGNGSTTAPGGSGGGSDSGNNDNGSSSSTGDKSSSEASLKALETINIADTQSVNYERSEWKHWIGSPCNTRETVLKEQGSDVKADEKTCKILSGSWLDPYSKTTFTDASKLDIDHVIPLGYAAKHGGQSWDASKKQEFANDVSQLLAVSASENRSKSDKGPSGYMPPNKDFQCQYAKIWVSTATKYALSITNSDKVALTAAIKKCAS